MGKVKTPFNCNVPIIIIIISLRLLQQLVPNNKNNK
jgi:hypothetical protein